MIAVGLLLAGGAVVVHASRLSPRDPIGAGVSTPLVHGATPAPTSSTPAAVASDTAHPVVPPPVARLDAKTIARGRALARLAEKARKFQQLSRKRPVATFTIANFNVQGASHRGNVAGRTRNARTLLDNYGVDVAAIQEFQRPQRVAFARIAGGTYSVYPGTTGRSLDAEDSVVWRTDRFDLVTAETRAYRYFRGAVRHMPRVLLRDRKTGTEFWVTSYHNPASCCGYGNSAGYRAGDVVAQAADANALVAATKTPLIVAGDMNDRATYFCAMAARTGMHSADGSTYDGGCRVAGHSWIDWIMGTRDVVFSGYLRDRGGFVRATSDHPIVVVQASVRGKPGDALHASR